VSALKIITLTYPISISEIGLNDQALSLAIGYFDGVHIGHQQVISRAVTIAKKSGIAAAVMTFDPHPKAVVGHGDQYDQCITPLHTKAELFEKLGVDYMFVVTFDEHFSKITPELFVSSILHELQVKQVVVGFDFKFGARGAGDVAMLKQLCEPQMNVDVVDAYVVDDLKVSSTMIRTHLENGDVVNVSKLLGRYFEVEGTVVHGDQRGRTIGFPTANLRLHAPYITLHLGVYAIIAHHKDQTYYGVLNHGMKPTFYAKDIVPVMEAHLFHFSDDIYGDDLKIEFVEFIRSERRFNGIQELIDQINLDSNFAKNLFKQT